MVQGRALALCSIASAALAIGCNSLLGIHEPSKQELVLDGGEGTLLHRDAGAGEPANTDRPPSSPETSGSGGSSSAPSASHRDAGAPSGSSTSDAGPPATTDAGAGEESPYLWANWPMPNPLVSALPNPQGYASLSTGRVADQVTHLEWQQVADDAARSWSDARAYCERLMLDGVTGWRLPSRIELVSLVDFSSANPAIDAQTFSDAPAEGFWSSSAFAGAGSAAWGVNFGFKDGFVFTDDVKELHRVRCVR